MIDKHDARNAKLIILIENGTTLPASAGVGHAIEAERSTGFPSMRDRFFASRTELRERVEALAARLATIAPF